ncbi:MULTISPECIES: hypothetical protein [unclassified Acinetobacter]|uniref:hypothetical protein n=1 Tax=unclassified Acinetobacter TaxID=196816 RepID=UPI002934E667|nr:MULTISPECIES: hypothetical protein [unclassified Acinetobacter]WOE32292.1 hypothetical protein QSG84_03525 [Acinetobacter sp. SAAs470]WOE37763.1 hypothetical protein QSG86_12570 [Acinetobacter sp. SAAs474]
MNRILVLSFLVLTLSMTVNAQDNLKSQLNKNKVQPTNTIKISLRPEIVGLWSMPIPNNKQCIEYYNFKSNNNLVVKSGAEWSTGLYEYQPNQQMDNKQAILTLNIQYDNNQLDCSGNRIDQSGEISQYLIKWRNARSFELCNTDKSSQCFAVLHKVSP